MSHKMQNKGHMQKEKNTKYLRNHFDIHFILSLLSLMFEFYLKFFLQ